MASGRTYGEACAAAHALDLVGERWALLVTRELLLGPKRFTDLRKGIVNASPNVLSQRLRELEQSGVVRRRVLPPPYGSRVYELTEWGAELEPVLTALGRWGARSPSHRPDIGMSLDSHVLAMRTMFRPAAAGDLRATLVLELGSCRFRAEIADGGLRLERGGDPDPDATLTVEPEILAALLWGGLDLALAESTGQVEISGDRDLVCRYLTLFPLPEKAAPTEAWAPA